jgi:hypothetical protein
MSALSVEKQTTVWFINDIAAAVKRPGGTRAPVLG